MEYRYPASRSPGLARYLRESPELGRALLNAAERGADAARAAAPVDSGQYRDSIRAERDDTNRSMQAARVVADVRYAADVEYRRGSDKPLSRAAVNAIEAFGG